MTHGKQKMFFVLKITGFESGTTNSLNLEQNTCHSQPMCKEISLRFNMSLREIFLSQVLSE